MLDVAVCPYHGEFSWISSVENKKCWKGGFDKVVWQGLWLPSWPVPLCLTGLSFTAHQRNQFLPRVSFGFAVTIHLLSWGRVLVYSTGWPHVHKSPPASASQVPVLEMWFLLDSFHTYYFYYVYMSVYHMCVASHRGQKNGIRSHGAGASGGCEPPYGCSGNQPLRYYKSATHS